MKTVFRVVLPFMAVLLMTACTSGREITGFDCPQTGFARDVSTLTVFAPESDKKDEESTVLEAQLADFDGGCSYVTKKGVLELDVAVRLLAKTGAAGEDLKEGSYDFSYFAAVLSPQEEILQRESFSITVDFDNNGMGGALDELTLAIPMADKTQAGRYKIVFGFELTQAQLDYNQGKK